MISGYQRFLDLRRHRPPLWSHGYKLYKVYYLNFYLAQNKLDLNYSFGLFLNVWIFYFRIRIIICLHNPVDNPVWLVWFLLSCEIFHDTFWHENVSSKSKRNSRIANILKTIKSHQVAGRNPMFELSSFHILKPLNQREAQFYQKFPRNLKDRSSESSWRHHRRIGEVTFSRTSSERENWHEWAWIKRFSPVYHGNATAILDDKNEIISFKSQRVLGTSRDDMSRTRLRKNLSNSDLHDDNRSESDDDSSAESRVNPWSNKLHNEDFNITKKCGKIFVNSRADLLAQKRLETIK